jgi:hypothetical protein
VHKKNCVLEYIFSLELKELAGELNKRSRTKGQQEGSLGA